MAVTPTRDSHLIALGAPFTARGELPPTRDSHLIAINSPPPPSRPVTRGSPPVTLNTSPIAPRGSPALSVTPPSHS